MDQRLPAPAQPEPQVFRDRSRLKSGASWFIWIGLLSLVNSFVSLAGGKWAFLIGLGVTQAADGVARGLDFGSTSTILAAFFDVFVATVFITFGLFAQKGRSWAFIVGMVLYGLDGLLFLLVADFLSLGFHVFALWNLFSGYRASRRLVAADPAPARAA
jgi:hypothetical protein